MGKISAQHRFAQSSQFFVFFDNAEFLPLQGWFMSYIGSLGAWLTYYKKKKRVCISCGTAQIVEFFLEAKGSLPVGGEWFLIASGWSTLPIFSKPIRLSVPGKLSLLYPKREQALIQNFRLTKKKKSAFPISFKIG